MVLIEAKHCFNPADITKKAKMFYEVERLMAQLAKQAVWPAGGAELWLFTAAQLWNYRHCSTTWFMAGAHFTGAMRQEAQAQGFRLVVLNGSRYSVLNQA